MQIKDGVVYATGLHEALQNMSAQLRLCGYQAKSQGQLWRLAYDVWQYRWEVKNA